MGVAPLRNNGWITVPWAEYVRKDASAGATLTTGWDGDQRATMQILINWNDGLQAEEDILGLSVFNPQPSPGYLARTPPVQHPYKASLRAERILDATPMIWESKLGVALPYAPGAGGANAELSQYGLWHVTIGFAVPKYTILTDTDLQNFYGGLEVYRWCEVNTKFKQDTISREAGTFIWQEQPPGVPPNQPFNGPWGQTITSAMIEVIWRRVPRVGLYGQAGLGDFLNFNLWSSIGLVHNGATAIWGVSNASAGQYKATTNGSVLRFLYPEVETIASPFLPLAQGQKWGYPNTFHNVKLLFHWFTPPSGSTTNFGHNLAPHPKDNLWYLVKTAGGGTIYPTGDITTAFKLTLT